MRICQFLQKSHQRSENLHTLLFYSVKLSQSKIQNFTSHSLEASLVVFLLKTLRIFDKIVNSIGRQTRSSPALFSVQFFRRHWGMEEATRSGSNSLNLSGHKVLLQYYRTGYVPTSPELERDGWTKIQIFKKIEANVLAF